MILTDPWNITDDAGMNAALEQARSAMGRVAPNPAVGAAIVLDDHFIAIGVTQPPPGPHAEVVALAAAGERALGADLYVTLEPCAHFGRTPPCVDAIISAGIRRVVVATTDPNPLVQGRGIERLRAAGVEVEIGLYADEAVELVGGFATRLTTGRPRVLAKYAMTLDGRIGTRAGHSRWVSGPESREHAHTLRDRSDAILAGVGTVLADDPLLTTRLAAERAGYGGPRHPLRVVLDSHARTPAGARMLSPDTPGKTLIVTTPDAPVERVAALRSAGAEVVVLPARDRRVDVAATLALLGEREINDLLVEGGGEIHGALFDARLVDRLCVYIAPVIVGGNGAPTPVAGAGVDLMPRAARLADRRVTALGDDLCVEGRIVYPEREDVDDV